MLALLLALRPTQWLKNLILYTAIVFNGYLFDGRLFLQVLYGFIAFCLVSSASYLINDLKDLPLDSKHPVKRHRPIASGAVRKSTAVVVALILITAGFFIAFSLSFTFMLILLFFFLFHIAYTFGLKKLAIVDIFTIAISFVLRGFAGEVLTGLHIPIWLMLTIVFLSLFIASAKRHSELLRVGTTSRPALFAYRERLLDFYATTFATATLLTYALFVFFEEPRELFHFVSPFALERKWLILTFPFVLLGIMRYAKIVYEKRGGETPEKLVTQDLPLLLTVLGWGMMVIAIIYLV